jgi:hypothetical protein
MGRISCSIFLITLISLHIPIFQPALPHQIYSEHNSVVLLFPAAPKPLNDGEFLSHPLASTFCFSVQIILYLILSKLFYRYSFYLSIYLSIYLSTRIHLSIYLPIYLLVSIYLSTYLSTRIYLSAYLPVCLSIYLWLYSPFVGSRPISQVLDLLHRGYDSLDGGSVRCKAATCTHRTAQTQNKRTQTSMPQVGFEPTIPAFELDKTVSALVRAATVIRCYSFYFSKYP